jgi:signal transduction histidine kinase
VALRVDALEPLALAAPPALPAIVISNLLRNAVEHTNAGEIRVALRDGRLTIADTGAGFEPAAQERLFDRDYSTKDSGGLGLHLSKRICDQFGWQLVLESAPGTGTTASVDFRPTPAAG